MYAAITGESIRQGQTNLGFRLMVVPAMTVPGLRMRNKKILFLAGAVCWCARLQQKTAIPGPEIEQDAGSEQESAKPLEGHEGERMVPDKTHGFHQTHDSLLLLKSAMVCGSAVCTAPSSRRCEPPPRAGQIRSSVQSCASLFGGRGRRMYYRKEQDPDIQTQTNQEQNPAHKQEGHECQRMVPHQAECL